MDKAPKDKETGLSTRYVSGLSSSIKKARASHWARTKKMDPGNPAAYEPAPGDKTAKTIESKYTKAYRAKFGEDIEMEEDYIDEDASSGLAKKAKESGISIGTLRKVYNRGMAAWRTGHRPGTTPQQWAMARVNSYITKGKGTYGGADKDLHEEDLDEACWTGYKKIGMKKKGKKMVPDCVPESYFKTGETIEPQSTNSNDSSSRFYGTKSAADIYKKNTPGQTKKIVKQAIREMLESQCPCGGDCECDKPKPKKNVDENKEYENPTGGLSQKGRDHYNSTTGSHLQAPVTKEPSKLKKGSKSYNRRKSFCARMGGMKKRLTGAKTAHDPDSRINKALRKWNC
jgi:hypothetical protein